MFLVNCLFLVFSHRKSMEDRFHKCFKKIRLWLNVADDENVTFLLNLDYQ